MFHSSFSAIFSPLFLFSFHIFTKHLGIFPTNCAFFFFYNQTIKVCHRKEVELKVISDTESRSIFFVIHCLLAGGALETGITLHQFCFRCFCLPSPILLGTFRITQKQIGSIDKSNNCGHRSVLKIQNFIIFISIFWLPLCSSLKRTYSFRYSNLGFHHQEYF